ncbi:MAG: tRNA-dihydrouridine synthase family protein [Planctomycetes bacterium]|nr:tRNA-dihydrouridine synthase family protein [Planctomycetota bacterium]
MRIGSLALDAPFFQAGLAGYSDAAMRLVARRRGCTYAVTEAMLDQALLSDPRELASAEPDPCDHPLGGQLLGHSPEEMAAAARLMVDLGYDVVDVNLACPVKKVRGKSRGGHLLSAPDRALAILSAVRQAVGGDTPCTVKLRRGTDDSREAEANFRRILEGAISLGYAAATVHARTVSQGYAGPSDGSFLAGLAATYGAVPGFSLLGSGDVREASDAVAMLRRTGVAGVSVARGAIGNPWIFYQARALLAGDETGARELPSLAKQREAIEEHFELALRVHGERRAALRMRKIGLAYARFHPCPEEVSRAFREISSSADWQAVLDSHYCIERQAKRPSTFGKRPPSTASEGAPSQSSRTDA